MNKAYESFTLDMSLLFLLSSSIWFVAGIFFFCRITSEEEFKKTIEKIPDYRIKEEKVKRQKSTQTCCLKNHPYAIVTQFSEARSSVNWFSKKSCPWERFSGKSRLWWWQSGRWRDVWGGNELRRSVRGRACSWCPAMKGFSPTHHPHSRIHLLPKLTIDRSHLRVDGWDEESRKVEREQFFCKLFLL